MLVVGETDLTPVRFRGGGLQGLRGRQEDDERQQAQSVACNHFGAAAVYAVRHKCVRLYWTSCRAFVRPSVSPSGCLSVCLSGARRVFGETFCGAGRLVCDVYTDRFDSTWSSVTVADAFLYLYRTAAANPSAPPARGP